MRKPSRADGFFLCYMLNLFWHAGWGALALVYTLFFRWVSSASNEPAPPQENKNPYSAKNEDFLPKAKEEAFDHGLRVWGRAAMKTTRRG